MMTKIVTGIRPGGRSARIQMAVHTAVKQLKLEMDVSVLTIPMIAERAGVTPSTIYRRWGDLSQLLADVAFDVLHPDSFPDDLGNFEKDLYAWIEQYAEEYTSEVGRKLLSDLLGANETPLSRKCYGFLIQQLDVIQNNAMKRGEKTIDNQLIIEIVIAPMFYRILFTEQALSLDYIHALLRRLFDFTQMNQIR